MEDRYDISVDVGDGKDWWYVHGLTTHDKVYELNRQMCDMGNIMDTQCFWDVVYAQIKASREASERRFAKYDKQNEDIMEEKKTKKTKKMTKAEAFEYLKGKKVLCCSSKMEAIQGFVKSLGFHWSDYSEEPMLVSILFLGEDGRLTYSGSLKRFKEHESPEISADDILSIEIIDEKKKSENVSIELEKWIGVIRDKFCCNHWSIVISASNFAFFSGDLIEEKRIKE